jgi:hypothetical protein
MSERFTPADLYDSTPEDDKRFMEERITVLLNKTQTRSITHTNLSQRVDLK